MTETDQSTALPQDSFDDDDILEQDKPTTFVNGINYNVELSEDESEVSFVGIDPAQNNPNFILSMQNLIFYKLHDDSRMTCKFGQRGESHIWQILSFKVTFYPNSEKMKNWVNTFSLELKKDLRPRRLMFIINPVAGDGSAREYFTKDVTPVLDDLEIEFQTFYTSRKTEATEICSSLRETRKYQGIVVLGGDGTVYEAVQGLLTFDKNHKLVSPQIPIGMVSCGTTNALAYTIHGTDDKHTSLVHILIGYRMNTDVLSMIDTAGNILAFSTTLISFGFIADAIKDSQNFNIFKGSTKYKISFVKALAKMKKYNCSFKFWEHSKKEPTKNGQEILCRHNCYVCANTISEDSEKTLKVVGLDEPSSFVVDFFNHPARCHISPYGGAPYAHICDGYLDIRFLGDVTRNEASNFLKHFTSSPEGPGVPLDFVNFMRAQRVFFKYHGPEDEEGCFIVDGECVFANEVGITSHHRALTIFGRGEELPNDEEILKYSRYSQNGGKSKCSLL